MSNHIPKLLILILTVQFAMSIRVILKRGEQFCTYNSLKTKCTFTGDYTASGQGGVNVTMYSPENEIVHFQESRRRGRWEIEAKEIGEYKTCFESSKNKNIFLTINSNVKNDQEKEEIAQKSFKNSNDGLTLANNLLKRILNYQKELKTMNRRDGKKMKDLTSKLNWTVMFKVLALISIAYGQFYFLKRLF